MPRKKKETGKARDDAFGMTPRVLETSLEDILADRFSRYSKYIIQERALPDARDGLKPVQRRILWAMYEDGNLFSRPYRKSAKTVGNVIGNYHPHGDFSVYDALVRMSQDWKSPIPLIDMQGNNGSIDDDPAAAMRYTEARLSKIAEYLMEDIDKETVEWAPNFSDDKMEPTVFPARYPNLLTQGITGIAAGYATSIPPHNFQEVINGTIHRIQNPECTLREMMGIIKGPDFPTGGIVMGIDGIKQAFATGKGRIIVRSKCAVEEGKTVNRIVVSEIPYDVVKSNMVKKIDEIRLEGKAPGMLDVRDESDRNGLRIVIDLKKEANAQAILNYLFKNTDLQTSYHYNVVAIVNKTPRQLGLLEMLDAFIEHRDQVIVLRSKYELAARMKRAHIVEGLIRAISILDEVIALIRASKNKADAKKALMERWSFSEMQAEAIVMLQLYRLTNTDVTLLEKEAKSLQSQIRQLQQLLDHPSKRKALMVKELQELLELFPAPRRSELVHEVEELVIDHKAMIAKEQTMLAISRQGYIKRTSLRSYSTSSKAAGRRDGDQILYCGEASTLDTLLIFTDRGRYASIPVYKLDEVRWKDVGSHISALAKMEPNEKIAAAFLQSEPPKNACLLFATSLGQIKRLHFEDLPAMRGTRMQTIMKVAPEDALIGAIPVYDPQEQAALFSEQGMCLRYPASEIPSSKAKTKGVAGIKLSGEDYLQCFVSIGEGSIVLENSLGQFKRIAAADLPAPKRPARGVRSFKAVKSRPVSLCYAAAQLADGQLQLDLPDPEMLSCSAIPKMNLQSTWSGVNAMEQPASFTLPLECLHDGSWALNEEEEEEQEKEDGQMSLFDLADA